MFVTRIHFFVIMSAAQKTQIVTKIHTAWIFCRRFSPYCGWLTSLSHSQSHKFTRGKQIRCVTYTLSLPFFFLFSFVFLWCRQIFPKCLHKQTQSIFIIELKYMCFFRITTTERLHTYIHKSAFCVYIHMSQFSKPSFSELIFTFERFIWLKKLFCVRWLFACRWCIYVSIYNNAMPHLEMVSMLFETF